MTPGRLVPVGYGMAALLILVPLSDLAVGVAPFHPGDVGWRYGAVGLGSNVLLTPLLGVSLATVTAVLADHRRVVRAMSVVTGLAALLLFVAGGSFVLDVLQLRAQVPPEAKPAFDVRGVHALAKMTAAGVVTVLLSMQSWRTSRLEAGRHVREASPPPLLGVELPERAMSG